MSLISLERVEPSERRYVPDVLVRELSAKLFVSLARSDQRRKGEMYLLGLLRTEGRKSIRNIAASVGDRTAEQSLHHFVASSTWDWAPLRAALAGYLEGVLRPRAWVVQPLVISKAGTETVGVARRFVSTIGQVVNSQEVFSVWAAGEEYSCPVNWRLALNQRWRDHLTSLSARVPESDLASSPLESIAGAVAELQRWTGRSGRPVVVDSPDLDSGAVAQHFQTSGTPFVAAARGSTRVRGVDPALPGSGPRELTAHQLLSMARTLRRPVIWTDPVTLRPRTSLVVAVRVALPRAGGPFLLLGEWIDPRGWPQRVWITDLTSASAGGVLRLAKLSQKVEHDFADVSLKVGLTEFSGRSFEGWHRHTTLASAAHAVLMLSQYRAGRSQPAPQPDWGRPG